MNSLQDSFKAAMDLLPALVFMGLSSMVRGIVEPELEKRLGRKLTDWDCQAYLRELDKKVEFESKQEIHKARQARMNDLKIIHDFVWNNNL